MKLKKILRKFGGPALGIAASVATGGLVDPVSGVALGTALVAGKAAKRAGKKVEAAGGAPVHKVTAPAAAVAAPTLVAMLAPVLGFDAGQVCSFATKLIDLLCTSPAAGGAAIGLLALLLHQIGGGAITATSGRS